MTSITDMASHTASAKDEVLVAILNNLSDFEIAQTQSWYRIPVSSFDKWLKRRWPPQWLAFYQTQVFDQEAYAINYYAKVLETHQRYRHELFPYEPLNEKTNRRYYQLMLSPLQKLSKPILSRRWRRIIFISTTWEKFSHSIEVNDLFDESPLEDRVWAALKRLQITAERQQFVEIGSFTAFLDFAVYCVSGKLNIETDGDTWHTNPKGNERDNVRDNTLKTKGWRVLRFNTSQVNEKLDTYCLPVIVENINGLGGVKEERVIPRPVRIDPSEPEQLSLFDDY